MEGRNIAFIGFRATGKSTVGRILAEKLGRTFVDMDRHLTANFGRDISCWVKLRGWDSFRREESSLLRVLAGSRGIVVSTGGGIVLDPSNREILRKHFFVVWLTATARTIQCRLAGDSRTSGDRPPLTDLPLEQEIECLLRERACLYTECADLILATDESPEADLASTVRDHLARLPSVSVG